MIDLTESKERVIIGRIFPNLDIFKEDAFQIEIKWPPTYHLRSIHVSISGEFSS